MAISLLVLKFIDFDNKEEFFMSISKKIRSGCKDNWNAFMLEGATFSENDIPFCPTTAIEMPKQLISYTRAKMIYNKHKKRGDTDFVVDACVHFYQDDQKFDGKRSGIWDYPFKAVEILRHFLGGIITPDFSTYADLPEPIKTFNIYRMRAFGYWYGPLLGYPVINNVRWGTEETFSYCFDGIPRNSIVAIGTVASGLKEVKNRKDFEIGFNKMIEVLKPHTIIVYGSDNYDFFDKIREEIKIIHFRSETDIAMRGELNE